MENTMEDLDRKQALSNYLDVDVSEIEAVGSNNKLYTDGTGEYEVLTDDEANKEALDVFKDVFEDASPEENLAWAKKWGFEEILNEGWCEDALNELSAEQFSGYNDEIEALTDQGYFEFGLPEEMCDYNKVAKFCLESDGRGILAGYDGEEGYASGDDEDYYIYRTN